MFKKLCNIRETLLRTHTKHFVQPTHDNHNNLVPLPPRPTLMALEDSKVAFFQRAAQIEISNQEIDALELAGVDTFAKYAFCSEYQPGQQDEKPLVNFLEATLGEAP